MVLIRNFVSEESVPKLCVLCVHLVLKTTIAATAVVGVMVAWVIETAAV